MHLVYALALCTVICMAQPAVTNGRSVFPIRLEVRLRTDQKDQLDELSDVLDCDVAALVRLAIDRMFEELETNRKREAQWQEQVAEISAATPRRPSA